MTGYVVLVFLSLVHFTFLSGTRCSKVGEHYPLDTLLSTGFDSAQQVLLFIYNLLYDNLSTGLLSTALLLEPLGSDAILYEILIIVISCENNCMTHLFSIE